MYGPGDQETWPPATGHANDPRLSEEYCTYCENPVGCCVECGADELELLREDVDRLERSVKYLNGELGWMRRYRDVAVAYAESLSLIAKHANSEGQVDVPDQQKLMVWQVAKGALAHGSAILMGADHA